MPKRLKQRKNRISIREIFRSSVEEQEQFPVGQRTSGRANFNKKKDVKTKSKKVKN